MNFNVAQHVAEQARTAPGRAAVICTHRSDDLGRTCLTFAELDAECDALAWGLSAHGLKPGMRTLLAVKPGLEFVALTFALFKAGAIPVLIDPGMGLFNFLTCVRRSNVEAFIGTPLATALCTYLGPGLEGGVGLSVYTGDAKLDFSRGQWLQRIRAMGNNKGVFPTFEAGATTRAAILFTSGGTGIPKGVCYEHGMFAAQLELIRTDFGVSAGETDLPAFPLFALFSTALGATCVIPDMDSSRPAQCDPRKIVEAMRGGNVTYSFGSPAIWKKVGPWCRKHNVTLPAVTRLFMAGAPVRADVLLPFTQILSEQADVFIPYGATEALPVCVMRGREVLRETWPLTRQGKGYCIGRPVSGISVKIIAPDEPAFRELGNGEIGEIAVSGPVVTKEYYLMPSETAKAKVRDAGVGFWHRMGDLGYRGADERLWFCGRKAHFVRDAAGVAHYSVCREAVLEEFMETYCAVTARAALVRKTRGGRVSAALAIEAPRGSAAQEKRAEIVAAWRASEGGGIVPQLCFYPHPFPVDVRHNAKIDREKLGRWASRWWRR